jgi:hypothetical protein
MILLKNFESLYPVAGHGNLVAPLPECRLQEMAGNDAIVCYQDLQASLTSVRKLVLQDQQWSYISLIGGQ